MQSGSRGFKGAGISHGVEVRVQLSAEFLQLEEPEVMANKGNLLRSLVTRLLVEEVASPQDRLLLPPVRVETIDGCRSLLSIDSDSLVQALLVGAQAPVRKTKVLISALHDFNRIGVHLAHRAHRRVRIPQLV